MTALPRVLITMGDPNGIGPEIAVKAAIELAAEGKVVPIVVGDAFLVKDADNEVELVSADELAPVDHIPGRPTPESGRACVAYLEHALAALRKGGASGIVGCPHSETAINASGRRFSGYPNLLAELCGTGPDSVFLMLVGGGLRVAHVTLHEPIRRALGRITPELIMRAVRVTDAGLRQMGIADPSIGVMGFNPHAGEGGLFGDEDDRIVAPALAALRGEGIDVTGPEGADVLLQRSGHDAFVAMYHDQGHIPVKLLGGRAVSALSLGAGVMFSSVGHGAAFEIAGQGVASHEGVVRAAHIVGGVDGL